MMLDRVQLPHDVPACLSVARLKVGYEAIRFSEEERGVFGLLGLRRRSFPILDSLSFTVKFDRPVATIVGPNGAGKTTLLRAIAGLIHSQGIVTWKGERIDLLNQHQRHSRGITFVPNENGLFPNLSVRENLELMERDPFKRKKSIERIAAAIENTSSGLTRNLGFLHSNAKAGNLSGGERKALSLLRLIFRSWSLILLDEPTAGLSGSWREIYRVLLSTLHPAVVIQAEQASRLLFMRSLGPVFELRERSLRVF